MRARAGSKIRGTRGVRYALGATAAAAALLVVGGTGASAKGLENLATLNGSSDGITCTEVQSDPQQTAPSLAQDSDGSKDGVARHYADANRTVNLTFVNGYGVSEQVTDIIVKIDNTYAVCHLDTPAKVGDVVTITDPPCKTAAISWVKYGWQPTPKPTPTVTPTETATPTPSSTRTPCPSKTPTSTPSTSMPEPSTSPVVLPEETPSTTPTVPATTGTTPSGGLAATGADVRTAGILTGVLVLLGAAVTLLARRRMANQRS